MKQLFIVAIGLLALSCGVNSLDFRADYGSRTTVVDGGREAAEPIFPHAVDTTDERIDLNDIFGSPNDSTDWNYTEIDEEDWAYLDSIGVYWDNESECYRKRK